MNTPELYLADQLRDWPVSCEIHRKWYAARPIGFDGFYLRHRLKLAWGVFTGRYDAVRWAGDVPPLYKEAKP